METIRTKIVWTYSPKDFFESNFNHTNCTGRVEINNGDIIVELNTSEDPVSAKTLKDVNDLITNIFNITQLLKNETYLLNNPIIRQEKPEGKKPTLMTFLSDTVILRDQIDFKIAIEDGNIVIDTKEKRINEHKRLTEIILNKSREHPLSEGLLNIFNSAMNEPSNELVRLFEIKEALKKYFGNEKNAISRLGVSRKRWNELGKICNDLPLKEGRHAGFHIDSLRKATKEELKMARNITRDLIISFIGLLD